MEGGLLYGLSQGLNQGFQAYMQARQYQDSQRLKNVALQMEAKKAGGLIDESGQFQSNPNDQQAQVLRNVLIDQYKKSSPDATDEQVNTMFPPNQTSDTYEKAANIYKSNYSGLLGLKGRQLSTDAADGREKRKEDKPTEGQLKAAGFGKRAETSDSILNDMGNERATYSAGLKSKVLPTGLLSSNLQQVEQAERDFVNSILRQESGAAISPSEFENAQKQYFPRAGDAPEVIQQKAANRQQAIANLKAQGSKAWDKIPSIGRVSKTKPASGKVKVSNGKEVLEIDASDLSSAQKDGYNPL